MFDYIEVSHPSNPRLRIAFWKTECRATATRHYKLLTHRKVKESHENRNNPIS